MCSLLAGQYKHCSGFLQIDVSSKGLPKGITAVVNLAGQNILDPASRWNDAFKQNVRNSRIKTTRTLAQAIADADERPKVFISMSGVGKKDENFSKFYSVFEIFGKKKSCKSIKLN